MSEKEKAKLVRLIKDVRAELCEATSLLKDNDFRIARVCLNHVCHLIVKALKPKK